jgi:hypothetical protein
MDAATRTDVLHALLDTQKLAGEMFDAVEADEFVITRNFLARVANLIGRLDAFYKPMVWEYALSGSAGRDFMNDVRRGLATQHPGGEAPTSPTRASQGGAEQAAAPTPG